jgi:hypothetical protein
MPKPFPGMNPWLERPGLWPDVHTSLIVALRRKLAPLVHPRYYIALEQRIVMAVVPAEPTPVYTDVAVIERSEPFQAKEPPEMAVAEPVIVEVPEQETITEDYLEVVEIATHRVITVIEILSLSNKRPGEDRQAYLSKREKIFRTQTNLVEIDLLRHWAPMPFAFLQTDGGASHYRILVKRGDQTRRAHLYPFNVRDPVPIFSLPLQVGDVEPPVYLGAVLREVYDESGYALRIDYGQPPVPPLSEEDAKWAADILRA